MVQSILTCYTPKTPTGTSLGTALFHRLHTQNTNRYFSWDSPLSPATHTKHQQVLLLVQSISACHRHKTPTGRFPGTVHFHLLHTQNTNRYFSWYSPFPPATHTKHNRYFSWYSPLSPAIHKPPRSTFLGTVTHTHKTPKGTSLDTVRFHLPHTQNITPRGTFVGTVHLHLQVPCFAYISSIHPFLDTFHLHALFLHTLHRYTLFCIHFIYIPCFP